MELVIIALSVVAVVLGCISLVLIATIYRRSKNDSHTVGADEAFIEAENKRLKDDFARTVGALSGNTFDAVQKMTDSNERRVTELGDRVNATLKEIREETARQLSDMRAVVDDKLNNTLTERFNSSFSVISERLEAVATKLGEVQSLTTGVTDLKRLMSNVKLRGGIGEVMLGELLSEILHESQYETQFKLSQGDDGRVDFAVRLPGKGEGEVIYLPIDSKFPSEAYLKLQDAAEQGDKDGVDAARKELLSAVEKQARSIRDKYIKVPKTTDFAVMYVPTEGLYAEIVKDPEFIKKLRECKVTPAGPTTLASILNALKIGFETLAIQRSTADIVKIFIQVKKDIATFNAEVAKISENLERVGKSIAGATERGRQIEKKINRLSIPEDTVNE